jgi:hypothetical protein
MDEDAPQCGWTIYHPVESFPGHFVVCQWWVREDGGVWPHSVACLCRSLEEAREQVPSGTICFVRDADDDETVIETWI